MKIRSTIQQYIKNITYSYVFLLLYGDKKIYTTLTRKLEGERHIFLPLNKLRNNLLNYLFKISDISRIKKKKFH